MLTIKNKLISLGLAGLMTIIANIGIATASTDLQPNVVNTIQLIEAYQQEAKKKDKSFMGFSAIRGHELYHKKETRGGKEKSCATCHTDDPMKQGKHPETGKALAGMAPAYYPKRFSNPHEKINVAFKRNCQNVFGRDCTVIEKGDILTYLLSVQPKK